MTKKYWAVILAMVMLVCSLTACSTSTPQSDTQQPVTQESTTFLTDETNFKLSYSQSDSLNPFSCETLNNQVLGELVFDSLFTLDENFEVQPNIATDYKYIDEKTITVNLNSTTKFSNGKDLTAESVVNSFNKAKKSPHWSNGLKAISSASVIDGSTVEFHLSYPNPNAHNLLTFAIAYSENDDKGYPIGSGKYKYNEGDGKVFLEVNKTHSDFNPHITKITLINITSAESIENAVNIGNISYAVRDLSNSTNIRTQCNKKSVSLNNLVYLGVNSKRGITSNENIRKAISLAIDRETLVKTSYQGYAKSATSVFHPSSDLGKITQVFSENSDLSGAKQAIAQSKLKNKSLSLSLAVNESEAKQSVATYVKQQLESAGFSVKINKMKNKEYRKAIKNGNFDLYIGETKLSNDMNLYGFFSKSGATHYGIDIEKSQTTDSYRSYMNGEAEIGKFILDFSEELPFIPLLYRQGMICFSKSMHGDMQGHTGNYFSNIEDWYFN